VRKKREKEGEREERISTREKRKETPASAKRGVSRKGGEDFQASV
jgi:hypothetical protein